MDESTLTQARQLHENALVWDMIWPWEPWCGNDLDKLERFAKAGHSVVSITIAGDNHNISQAVERIGEARRRLRIAEPAAVFCKSVQDIRAAHEQRRLAVLLHFEGTRCFERNLDMVEIFYALGIRHTLLAFNNANSVGGGCMEAEDGGLTAFGRKLVAEMERVGMLVDLSHTGHRTAMQVMEAATKPCLYTHSNSGAVFSHPRNVSDDEIRACADTGGLVGLAGSSMYHGDTSCRAEALFPHLDHIVSLAGAEHVGLGVDTIFNPEPLRAWMRERPDEWPQASDPNWPGVRTVMPEELQRLTALMLEHGYPEESIRNILGLNYVRICQAVWT